MTPCIETTATINANGYGSSWIGIGPRARYQVLAHRFAFEQAHGPVKPGHHVTHSCDNRKCINPDHLWQGDNMSNQADRFDKMYRAQGKAWHRLNSCAIAPTRRAKNRATLITAITSTSTTTTTLRARRGQLNDV